MRELRRENWRTTLYPSPCIILVIYCMSLEKMVGSMCFCNLALFLLVTHSPFPVVLAADSYCRADFPSDFVFGAGSSSYQVPFPYIHLLLQFSFPRFTNRMLFIYFFPIFSTIARNLSLLFRTRLIECANLLSSTGLRLALFVNH